VKKSIEEMDKVMMGAAGFFGLFYRDNSG
jgi:hypothetical protein